jgi:hypothetical protein
MRTVAIIIASALLIALVGCGSGETKEVSLQILPTMTELENMEYRSSFTENGLARLVNGSYQEQKDDGFGTVLVVTLTNFRFVGYLNAKTEGGVAIIRTSAGPNGTFYDLAAIIKDSSGIRNVANASLGDRIKIANVVLEDHVIRVQMTTHAPQDLPCCPTLEVVNTYELRGNRLVQLKSEPFVP